MNNQLACTDERPILWPCMRDAAFRVVVVNVLGLAFDSPRLTATEHEALLSCWERMPADDPVFGYSLAKVRCLHGQYLAGQYTPTDTWDVGSWISYPAC